MFVHVFKSLFSRAEAGEIVAMAGRSHHEAASLVGGQQYHNIRRARLAWLDDAGEAAWVMRRIVEAVAEANRETFRFALDDFAERLQVACYDGRDRGHFDWHADIGDGALARRRKLTIVAQLSEDNSYEGGTLQLNPAGHGVNASRGLGDAVAFASFVLHKVSPVTRGERHSLTCWVHGPDFR